MRMIDFFAGVCRFETDEKNAELVLNLLLKSGIVYRDLAVKDGKTVLFCSHAAAKRLAAMCQRHGAEASFRIIYGLPGKYGAIRRRAGLVVGALAALVVLILGESVIWDVRVTGCGRVLTATETKEIFAELGVRPGVFRRSVNADRTAAAAVTVSDKLAWAAVNIRGTTAVIEVREQIDPPQETKDPFAGYDGVNLIAGKSGLVVDMEIISGKPVITRGRSVKKGDLLVSGIIDSTRIGFRLTHASGEVRAETVHEIEVEIPYKYEKKVCDGREELEIWLIFFSKEIKLFKKGGNAEAESDTIIKRDLITLPGGKVVPIGLGTTRRIGYAVTDAVRSAEDAERLARHELARRIAELLSGGAYPVRRTVSSEAGEDAYRVRCELVVVENIAKKQGFEFDITGNDAAAAD